MARLRLVEYGQLHFCRLFSLAKSNYSETCSHWQFIFSYLFFNLFSPLSFVLFFKLPSLELIKKGKRKYCLRSGGYFHSEYHHPNRIAMAKIKQGVSHDLKICICALAYGTKPNNYNCTFFGALACPGHLLDLEVVQFTCSLSSNVTTCYWIFHSFCKHVEPDSAEVKV